MYTFVINNDPFHTLNLFMNSPLINMIYSIQNILLYMFLGDSIK